MRSSSLVWEVRRWAFLNVFFFLSLPYKRSANWTLRILDLVQRRERLVCSFGY